MTGPEATAVTYRRERRATRRLVFEPLADGGHLKREAVRTERGTWREVGSEVVTEVVVEAPADA